ncbi:MAG: hypothetical protein Q9167_007353 [Letrouitia subvulpina]
MSCSRQPIQSSLLRLKKAAEVLRKKREDHFNAISEIPTILSGTQRVLAIHRMSENLQNYSSALYVAVLHALAHILLYFKRKAISKFGAALGRQENFESNLCRKLDTVRRCSNAFNEEAMLCHDELMKKISQDVSNTNHVAKRAYEKVGITIEMVEYSQQEQARTLQEMRSRLQAAEETAKEMNENLKGTTEALNAVRALLHANPKIYENPAVESK